MKKSIISLAFILSVCAFISPVFSMEKTDYNCDKLPEVVSGDQQKYSMHADVDGAFALQTIPCAVELRKELCAMEMVSFDQSAKVFDFMSGDEVTMTEAYYLVDPAKKDRGKATITAFKNKEDAQKHVNQGSGKVVDYTELVLMKF